MNHTMPSLIPIASYDVAGDSAAPNDQSWPSFDNPDGYRWVDINGEDPIAIEWVNEQLPSLAARALLQNEIRPRCEGHDGGITVNLRGVNGNPDGEAEDMVSIRLWMTDHNVVSAHSNDILGLDELSARLRGDNPPRTVGSFLRQLIGRLTEHIEALSIELEERTDELEDRSLDNQPVTSSEIADLEQSLIKVRRSINPQRDALNHLVTRGRQILSDDDAMLIAEDINRTQRAIEELDEARERLVAIKDKLDADHDKAIGRNSYVLSVVAAIFLPLSFLAGLFGVNVAGMPGADVPNAFWLLSIGMVFSGIGLYLVFKFAKWL